MQIKKIIAARYCRFSDNDEQDCTSISIAPKNSLMIYCRDLEITDNTFSAVTDERKKL